MNAITTGELQTILKQFIAILANDPTNQKLIQTVLEKVERSASSDLSDYLPIVSDVCNNYERLLSSNETAEQFRLRQQQNRTARHIILIREELEEILGTKIALIQKKELSHA